MFLKFFFSLKMNEYVRSSLDVRDMSIDSRE